MDAARTSHAELAEALRHRVLDGPGETLPTLRQMAAKAAAGGGGEGPAGALACRIGEASYAVTDAEVAAVRAQTGSERAVFEIIAAAAMGAGLLRWRQGLAAIEGPAMRLPEIDRGDSLGNRLLIGFISRVSGMRLPDAARVAFYHKAFFSAPMGTWTQAVMRGDSEWSVGERELMAAVVAKWNACPFCVGAHGAIAARVMCRATVDAALADFQAAELSEGLEATLTFLEKLTLHPTEIAADDARTVYASGVSRVALTDAIAVASVFAIITRYANALDFAMPTPAEFDKAGVMLLKRGYA